MIDCICSPEPWRAPEPGCPVHDPRPAGEPPAQLAEEQLPDLEVFDGPNAGQVWTYVADQGGFMRADGGEDTICREAAAVIEHVSGNVRPVQR